MTHSVRDFDIGGQIIRSADGTVAGTWWRLQAIEASTLAAGSVADDLIGSPVGLQLAAGVEIRARWSAVAISSGSVVAYR
jgi:hypothetical protein